MSDLILTEQKLIESCIENCFEGYKELLEELGDVFGEGGIFVKPNLYDMTTKKYREKMDVAEFLQWGRRNPSRFIEEVFNVRLMDYQRYLIDSSWSKPFVVWAMSRNGGKALSLDTPLLTPDGTYTTMEKVSVGDYVIGDDGKPTRVISTSPIFYGHKCYQLTFDDGEKIVADADHIWSVYDRRDAENWILKDITTKEMVKNFVFYNDNLDHLDFTYGVPICKPIELSTDNLTHRLDLVRKFMDANGDCDGNQCYFHAERYLEAYQFGKILNTLGIKWQVINENNKPVVVFMSSKEMPLFSLQEKIDKLPDKLPREATYKTILSIQEVESVPTKCISVDNETHRYLCGYKNTVTHNSVLAALFIMAKMLLIPGFKAYILAGVGSQSIELFTKMEQFAMKNIASFTNLNDIFQSNVVKNQANSSGWVHNPASYTVRTYGGSQCFTLNGSFDNNRSSASSLLDLYFYI